MKDFGKHSTTQLNRIWYGYHNRQPQHYDSSRYHGVNLHNVWYRGTVEFRWFEATLHAGRIKAYLQFCLAVATKALGHLEQLGIVKELTAQKRNRLFSYAGYIEIMSRGTERPSS